MLIFLKASVTVSFNSSSWKDRKLAYSMDFDYGETYTLMRKFRELTKQEVRIMDYLIKMDVFEGTYSELAKAIGDETLCSNVRKALLHLQSMGIVNIVNVYYEDEAKKHPNNPMKACYIVAGWMYALLRDGWDKVEPIHALGL